MHDFMRKKGHFSFQVQELAIPKLITAKFNYGKQIQEENRSGLVFDSNFEMGNLFRVYQLSQFEYNLILTSDFNTNQYSLKILFIFIS